MGSPDVIIIRLKDGIKKEKERKTPEWFFKWRQTECLHRDRGVPTVLSREPQYLH